MFRYTDLWPDVPMADDSNVLELYADHIAALALHGANFTTTYFTWARKGPRGLLQRVPVIKIVRPRTSLAGMRETLAEMEQSPSIVPH
jgi:hypothetical protein